MVRIEQQLALIESVRKKIDEAQRRGDWKRRNDLVKYKKRLIEELKEAEKFLGIGW